MENQERKSDGVVAVVEVAGPLREFRVQDAKSQGRVRTGLKSLCPVHKNAMPYNLSPSRKNLEAGYSFQELVPTLPRS